MHEQLRPIATIGFVGLGVMGEAMCATWPAEPAAVCVGT